MKKKVLLYQDNVPVHTFVIAMTSINKLKFNLFELFPRAPYSPDLTLSNYFLLPNLKNAMVVKDLSTINMWSLVEDNFEELWLGLMIKVLLIEKVS